MSKKDYELIARVILARVAAAPAETRGELCGLARDMADNLAGTNPLFDRARFLKACGVAA